jgi:hypothetical protein
MKSVIEKERLNDQNFVIAKQFIIKGEMDKANAILSTKGKIYFGNTKTQQDVAIHQNVW